MRKHIAFVLFVTIITMVLSMANAQAKDIVLDTVAKQVTAKLDKNGHEYVRIIIKQEKSLEGHKYTITTPVMFFGELVEQAKEIKVGQSFKAIVNVGEYKGRESMTALSLIE